MSFLKCPSIWANDISYQLGIGKRVDAVLTIVTADT